MKLMIAGDLIPTEMNYDLFKNGKDYEIIQGRLLDIWKGADFRIVNLETPLTKYEKKKCKHGLNIRTDPSVVHGLKELRIDCVSLANNHILDYGQVGLQDTIDTLEKSAISYFGLAQHTSKEYFIIDDGCIKVGLLGCSDREFSVPSNGLPGAYPFDFYETNKLIREIRTSVDYLIVLYHGGTEFYQYPTVNLKKICHCMIDAGANAVICQHGHCVVACEEYNGGIIVYGQGHFISNLSFNPELKKELIVSVCCDKQEFIVDYIPVEVVNYCSIRLQERELCNNILTEFLERSVNLDDDFLNVKYQEWLDKKRTSYLIALKGNRLYDRIMVKVFGKKHIDRLYSPAQLRVIYNYLNNNSHLEALQEIVKKEVGL